jgi:diguanylate cyclase (GGDEF)-like protein/PAS domain S-box-containing protein
VRVGLRGEGVTQEVVTISGTASRQGAPVIAMANAPRCGRAQRTMEELGASPDVFETFFQRAAIGLALADLSGRYIRVNDTYAHVLGRQPEDLVGVLVAQVLTGDERCPDGDWVALLLDGTESSLQTEERYVGPDGGQLWVLHGVTVIPGLDGRPAWFAVSAQNITERRRAEEALRSLTETLTEQTSKDPLTGLANRTLLEERLRAALSRDGRTGLSTAVLFLDLDGFKAVNDRHGHATGDLVLQAIAQQLATAVRPADTVARVGGDEFVVLVEGATEQGVDSLVTRLEQAVDAATSTLDLKVGVSVGVAVSHAGETAPLTLLHAADAAMYAVKGSRRGARPTRSNRVT